MTFKILTNLVHDLLIILFMVGGLVMMFYGHTDGAIIMLLAMIEDSVYKRR